MSPLRFAPLLASPSTFLLVLSACTMDRTGQSASEQYRKQMLMQATQIENLQSQVNDMGGRLDRLDELTHARGQEEVLRMETLEQVRGEVSRLRGAYEELKFGTERSGADSKARLEDAAFRLEWLDLRATQLEKNLGVRTPPPPDRGDVAKPPEGGTETAVTTPPPAPKEGATEVTDPAELMKLGNDHLKASRHQAAEAIFTRFLSLHPKHEKAPEARYRLGEAAFNAKNYPQAVLRFQEVVDKDKKSKWAPWAMVRQGECFDAQGQKDNAKLFYEEVVRLWPDSDAAKDAREKLKKRK